MNVIRNSGIFLGKNWYKFLIRFVLASYIEVILPALTEILTALKGSGTTYDFSVLGVTLNSLRDHGGSYSHFVSIWYNPLAISAEMLHELFLLDYSQTVAFWGLEFTWGYLIPMTYGIFFITFAAATAFVFF